MMKKKKVLAVLVSVGLLVLMVGGLTGCSDSGTTSTVDSVSVEVRTEEPTEPEPDPQLVYSSDFAKIYFVKIEEQSDGELKIYLNYENLFNDYVSPSLYDLYINGYDVLLESTRGLYDLETIKPGNTCESYVITCNWEGFQISVDEIYEITIGGCIDDYECTQAQTSYHKSIEDFTIKF